MWPQNPAQVSRLNWPNLLCVLYVTYVNTLRTYASKCAHLLRTIARTYARVNEELCASFRDCAWTPTCTRGVYTRKYAIVCRSFYTGRNVWATKNWCIHCNYIICSDWTMSCVVTIMATRVKKATVFAASKLGYETEERAEGSSKSVCRWQ